MKRECIRPRVTERRMSLTWIALSGFFLFQSSKWNAFIAIVYIISSLRSKQTGKQTYKNDQTWARTLCLRATYCRSPTHVFAKSYSKCTCDLQVFGAIWCHFHATNKTYADPGKSYRALTVSRAVVSRSSQISSHVWPLQDLPVGFRRCDDHRPDSAFSPDETSQQNHSISYGEGKTSGAQHILYASLFLCLHSLQEGSYSMCHSFS